MTTLEGRFQPQVWVNDNALDDGPSETFDAGAALLLLRADVFRYTVRQAHESSGRDLDELAVAAGLVGPDAHDGPFYVKVDAHDLTDFLVEVGITDIEAVTDATLLRIRADLLDAASAPKP